LNYVVDPLGWQMFSSGFSLDTTTTSANDFGYFSSNGLGSGVAGTNYGSPALIFANHRLLRINGGLTDLTSTTNALAISEGFGLHGDTWNVEIVSLIESVTTVGALAGNRAAVFPSTVDLSPYVSPNGQVRIVLSNVDQTMTVTRILEPIDLSVAVDPVTRTVMWREPLPTGFVPDGICRLERVDKRYSWLATVNKQTNGTAKVTVAVVFKRSFTPDDEHVYSTNFATGFADQASVSWGAGEPKPLLREGNYVLDAMTARWYRILAVSGSTSPVTVTFDQKIPLNHQVTGGRLIVMRGIVEIFEL
jgi:hypothetical protein